MTPELSNKLYMGKETQTMVADGNKNLLKVQNAISEAHGALQGLIRRVRAMLA